MQPSVLQKRIIIIGLVVALGFVLFQLKWKNNCMQSSGTLKPQYMTIIERDEEQISHNAEKVSNDICAYTDKIINDSFIGVTDLRNQLLDKTIKASDVVKAEYLIPKGMKIPQHQHPAVGSTKIRGNVTSPKMIGKASDVKESYKTITDLPNWFEKDLLVTGTTTNFPVGI
jgi:hypothetical protein